MTVPPDSELACERPLAIVLINDRGFRYGAGMAVFRQAQSLLLAGHSVTLIAGNLDVQWHQAVDYSVLKSFPGRWRGVYVLPSLPRIEDHHAIQPTVDAVFGRLVDTVTELQADVVLVGNIHGANWPLDWLGRLHAHFPKVVAFTHDAFYLTGRCAYPGDCDRLFVGCNESCPTAGEYPTLDNRLIESAWATRDRLFNRSDGVPLATNSRWAADIARRRYPAASFIDCVHYGLDELAYGPGGRSLARRSLGLGQDETVICTGAVDASERRKGGDLLIPLVEELGRRPGVRVLVFGLIGALQERLAAMPHVRCAGFVKAEEMPILLSASDVFVGLSREEAFGQTFIEAAACGVPSVAFGVGGIGDAILHGETGILCSEVSLEAMSRNIGSFLDDPVRRRLSGRNARAWVSRHFTLAAQARRWGAYLSACPFRGVRRA